MRTHLLYIIIGVLLAGNVALLVKKTPLPSLPARAIQQRDLPERVVLLDTLVLRRWSDNTVVRPDFRKPTFLFFFSKADCASCVDKTIDFLSTHASPAMDTYIVSTDIYGTMEREPYNARFLRALPFFALELVRRTPALEVGLPVLMVVDDRRQILFAKQILPSDDLQGNYIFWKRINFLYSLLAL